MEARLVRTAAAGALVLTLVAGGVLAHRFWQQRQLPLYEAAAILDGPGRPPVELRDGLGAGPVPVVPELGTSTLVADAAGDLHSLSGHGRVAVAGWEPGWRYVWPRDAAFVTSALARTGRTGDALRTLDFLQQVQEPDGTFHARYRPDGSGPPDDRQPQLDGTGWAVWAVAEVLRTESSPGARRALLKRYGSLLDRSTSALLRLTGRGTSLPPVSPDYWETPVRKPTLATSAVLLAGMRGAAYAYGIDDPPRARALTATAETFEALILARFADGGFPRMAGGPRHSVDLGVTLLRAPFAGVEDARVAETWLASERYLRRPAGGLAPGGSWRRDGVSWTNVTATFAMAEACGAPRTAAVARLRWLDAHRAPGGALPEKVLADGSPASVAPLAWTSAAVVITADLLRRGCPR